LHMAVMVLTFALVRICQNAFVLYWYSRWIWCTELIFLKKYQYVSISKGASIICLFLKNILYNYIREKIQYIFYEEGSVCFFPEEVKTLLIFVKDSVSFSSRRKLNLYLWSSFSVFLFLKKFHHDIASYSAFQLL
jgi:hypothetical protein